MKVIIDGVLHDAADELVIIHLSDQEKANINDMPPDFSLYAGFPQDMDPEDIRGILEEWKEKLGGEAAGWAEPLSMHKEKIGEATGLSFDTNVIITNDALLTCESCGRLPGYWPGPGRARRQARDHLRKNHSRMADDSE